MIWNDSLREVKKKSQVLLRIVKEKQHHESEDGVLFTLQR